MLSSRNIHFAILGVILGGASGYILAFYQAQSSLQRAPASVASASTTPATPATPPDHPEVSKEKMVALFNEALQKNPNDPELMTRYAGFLYENANYPDSIQWYQKVLALKPEDTNARADMATAMWKMGEREKALAEYQTALKSDSKNVFLWHTVTLVQIGLKDFKAAADSVKRIEEIEPTYQALPQLKKQLEQATNTKAPN